MSDSIDWEQLDAVVGDGSDGMAELFQEFVVDVSEKLARMAGGATAENASAVAWDAHQMKGSSGSFGLHAFASAASTLEQQAKQGDLAGATSLIARMPELFRESVTRIRAERSFLKA